MKNGIRIEICAGSIEDVITASRYDAVDRIEFNSALELGGLTPGFASFLEARRITDKKLICMCRPRPAGFRYSSKEVSVLCEEAELFLKHGADGIVFGILMDDCTIDAKTTEQLASLAHHYGKEAVFHKAFDETPDRLAAARTLIACGIDRVLTSGGSPDVISGMEEIALLQKTYGEQLQILPGGGVSEDNARLLLQKTGCTQLHMSAKISRNDSGAYYAVSGSRIEAVCSTL
jgi:copper homeostasis protein